MLSRVRPFISLPRIGHAGAYSHYSAEETAVTKHAPHKRAKVFYRAPVWIVMEQKHGIWQQHTFADWTDAIKYAYKEG